MRKLASIQRVLKVEPIPTADNLEVATVLGWHCVTKKGEVSVGDLVVYIETDSILPERPEFEFMRARHFKVKTVKLRGQISQGLVLPLSILDGTIDMPYGQVTSWEALGEDYDVTKILGITKYEPELPKNMQGKTKSPYRYKYTWLPSGFYNIARKLLSQKLFKKYLCTISGNSFPEWLVKTDETRVQVLQDLLDKYQGTLCCITEKLDGSSITCYLRNGEFGVCSRNVDLKEELGNTFWDTVVAMDIEGKMREYAANWSCFENFAIQGELIGEGIQGNKLRIKGQTIRFFNAFDITKQEYLGYDGFIAVMEDLGLTTVPVLQTKYELG